MVGLADRHGSATTQMNRLGGKASYVEMDTRASWSLRTRVAPCDQRDDIQRAAASSLLLEMLQVSVCVVEGQEMNEPRSRAALSSIAERETEEYLRRSSTRFLECAIHLCASHMSMEDVAKLLEDQAKIVRAFS